MTNRSHLTWYKQPWLLFILAFPASAIIVSMFLLFTSLYHADDLVMDDYHKDGLDINESFEREWAAQKLGLAAQLTIDELTGEVLVKFNQTLQSPTNRPTEEPLLLSFEHPTLAKKDQLVTLKPAPNNYYRGQLSSRLKGRWYLNLEPADKSWRMMQQVSFPQTQPLVLGPQN
jgi:hypothetical protein